MTTVLLVMKDVLDAMIDDDYELAAEKANELAQQLTEDGCPPPLELVKTLAKASKHYREVIEETDLDTLDFEANDDDEEEGFFDPEEIDFDV